MKKLFSTIAAISFAIVGINVSAETASPDASPEARPAETSVEATAPEVAPAVRTTSNVEIPQSIANHLALRFPGETVKGITREGVTYVVDLGDGLHIRYDNCFNPVCYGIHDHEH
ncbi:MAG: hypothetical protein K2I92_07995 [Muribaculaceae bacterium]|nr:hypothetical protein [Muribaculaceae bacterium]